MRMRQLVPNPLVKWNLNLERTVFDGGAEGARPRRTMGLVSAQLAFWGAAS